MASVISGSHAFTPPNVTPVKRTMAWNDTATRLVGCMLGAPLGTTVGLAVGEDVSPGFDGDREGAIVGLALGATLGLALGETVGPILGNDVGEHAHNSVALKISCTISSGPHVSAPKHVPILVWLHAHGLQLWSHADWPRHMEAPSHAVGIPHSHF